VAPDLRARPGRRGNPGLKPGLSTGLIRNVTRLKTVPWASVPRCVATPVTFAKAPTSGLELELKGRAGELLPAVFDARTPLNLRLALNGHWSRADAVPGPNARLDGRQPWSGNRFDDRFAGPPLSLSASVALTPGYTTRQTEVQSQQQSRTRSFDAFARQAFASGRTTRTERQGRTFCSAGLDMKL
jgi:iron complex outermembrane receptor protein